MKVQTTSQSLTCPECGQPGKPQLFKLQGQSTYRCANCLGELSSTQGPDKNIAIDGVQVAGTTEGDPDGDGD